MSVSTDCCVDRDAGGLEVSCVSRKSELSTTRMAVSGVAFTGTRNVNLVPSGRTACISSPGFAFGGIFTVTCRGTNVLDNRLCGIDGGISTNIVLPGLTPGGTLHWTLDPEGDVTCII